MSTFDPDWLALRERYDHVDRSGVLAAKFAAAVGPTPRLIDLGCGTGSNLRYLSPRLGPHQVWLCLDNDPQLLDAAAVAITRWADSRGLVHGAPGRRLHLSGTRASVEVALTRRNLKDIRRAFSLDGVDGLTASALLDLASAPWLEALGHRITAAEVPVLFALSYDGRLEWDPPLPGDELVRRRFHAHQRTDKGFGPALGPDAAAWLAERLDAQGWQVKLSRSDWRLDGRDRELLQALFEGVVAAAREIEDDAVLAAWAEARRRQLDSARLRVTAGHLDLLALPAGAA